MLQRFYGGDPDRWFDLPMPILNAYLTMLSRLQARERLSGMNVIGLAVGGAEDLEARQLLTQWQQAAHLEKTVRPASPAELAELGIGYVERD